MMTQDRLPGWRSLLFIAAGTLIAWVAILAAAIAICRMI